ncbi:MAG: ATP synthase F0 subunit B [Terriglobia bacterium]|jgi:F-type H+-transporting ATPase subunit b
MGDIFRQLGHLFLQAIPTVIFVFVLFVVLDRLFFRPLIAVLKKRADATLGALARAREQATAAESKTKEYEERFQAARQDVYRQREAERRVSLAEREAALQKARQQTEVMVQEAQARLAKEVAGVRAELESACRPLAEMISQSLVGPESTTGGGGGARL